jgi:uncharacterized membrane protein
MDAHAAQREPHWPASVAILALFIIVFAMPNRYVLGPTWVAAVAGMVLLALFVLSVLSHRTPTARTFRNPIVLAVVGVVTVLNILSLAQLLNLVVFHPKDVDGARLLGSSVVVWIGNVIQFALLYWLVDRGGPDERRTAPPSRTDFVFPSPPGNDNWYPNFLDYFYLSFSTATAFSATDTVPVTTRARVMMMVEAMASLLTIAITAARAVNVLQ